MSIIDGIYRSFLLPVIGMVILILCAVLGGGLVLILSIPAAVFACATALFKVPRDMLLLLLRGFLDGASKAVVAGGIQIKEKQ